MTACRRSVLFATAVLVVVPLAACSDDSKPSPASNASLSAAAVTSSTTTTTTTTPASGGPCDATPVPATAVRVTEGHGDFNADHNDDTLTVYGTGTVDQPAPYHVHIELGNSAGAVDDVIADAANDSNSVVKALGGSDITASAGLPPDGSGDEAFVTIGSGASAALIGVYQLTNCVLTRLTGPLGQQPSSFAVGGSVTHLDGLRCDGTAGGVRLVQLSAESADGLTYQTTDVRLQVNDGQFTATNTVNNTLDASDPQLQAYAGLDCPGVDVP